MHPFKSFQVIIWMRYYLIREIYQGLSLSSDPEMKTDISQPFGTMSNHAAKGEDKTLGSVLANRYRVDACLGKGGMGAVYSATDLVVNRQVAIKIVLPHYALDATSMMRLQQEARAIGRLDHHPNIIKLHDICVPEDGPPFLVMDLLVGSTLADLIRTEGQLAVGEALEIFVQTCAGLENAHAKGVLHRDLKPSNIMIVGRDRATPCVKILDFGMAKISESGDDNQLTKTGQVFGSPFYMSPEQAAGKRLDARADIYSLGCAFFEALTGAPPFSGDTAIATIIKHQTDKPPSLQEASLGKFFPPRLEAVVQKMLAKNPDDRYQSVSQLLKDLHQVDYAQIDDSAHDQAAKSRPKRSFSTAAIIAAVAAAVILLLSFGWHFLNQELPPKHRETSGPAIIHGLPANILNLGNEEGAYSDIDATPRDDLKLRLKTFKLSDKSLKLLHQFSSLQELNIGQAIFDDRHYGLQGIEALPLQRVILTECNSASERSFEQISHIHGLEYLEANSTKITDHSLQLLLKCPNLNTIYLNGCKLITDAGMEPVGKMPRLRVLELQNCLLGDKACYFLSASKSIDYLDLSGTEISDIGLAHIARMPRLRVLILENNTRITGRGISFLAKCKSLQALYIHGAGDVSADVVSVLSEHGKVQVHTYERGRHAAEAD